MFYLVIVLFVISGAKTEAAKNISHGPKTNSTRIIGGQQIGINKARWQVAIFYNREFGCGGSIVNSSYILTAAHCLVGVRPSTVTIRAGSANRNSGGQLRSAKQFIINSGFRLSTYNNDIGMIKLSKPLTYNQQVGPVKLPTTRTPPSGYGTVSGWGVTSEGSENIPVLLRAVRVQFIPRRRCQQQYSSRNFTITRSMICAGSNNGGKDACQGDSGGALVDAGIEYGITSYGQGCGEKGFSGVYTSVFEELGWIRNVLSNY